MSGKRGNGVPGETRRSGAGLVRRLEKLAVALLAWATAVAIMLTGFILLEAFVPERDGEFETARQRAAMVEAGQTYDRVLSEYGDAWHAEEMAQAVYEKIMSGGGPQGAVPPGSSCETGRSEICEEVVMGSDGNHGYRCTSGEGNL